MQYDCYCHTEYVVKPKTAHPEGRGVGEERGGGGGGGSVLSPLIGLTSQGRCFSLSSLNLVKVWDRIALKGKIMFELFNFSTTLFNWLVDCFYFKKNSDSEIYKHSYIKYVNTKQNNTYNDDFYV